MPSRSFFYDAGNPEASRSAEGHAIPQDHRSQNRGSFHPDPLDYDRKKGVVAGPLLSRGNLSLKQVFSENKSILRYFQQVWTS